MPPFDVPAYHCVNGHHPCSIYTHTHTHTHTHTLMHGQTEEKQYHISQPRTLVPLNHDGCKDRYTVLAHLHFGITFQFGQSEQKVFNENVTAEWSAVLVHSRNVLGFSYEPQMEHFDCKRSYISSVPQDKHRYSTLNQNTTASFHILSHFLSHNDLI